MARMTLPRRCQPIEALLLDVDGVLTDGAIVYGARGEELKAFHVRDGSGLKFWLSEGKRAALISGRRSEAVMRRALELDLRPVLQGIEDKKAALSRVLAELELRPEQACFVGDDVPDLEVLGAVGLAVAVGDGCAEVQAAAHYVTAAAGGRGAVREVVELVLKCQGRWDGVVARYRPARA